MSGNLSFRSALELLNLPQNDNDSWDEREYRAVFAHFLDSPIVETVAALDPMLLGQFEHEAPLTCDRETRFESALASDRVPPLSLFQLVKEVAKACLARRELGLPQPVAEVLYYLAIGGAAVGHGRWISSLPRAEMEDGIRQILQWDWIDERVRVLLTRCLNLHGQGKDPKK